MRKDPRNLDDREVDGLGIRLGSCLPTSYSKFRSHDCLPTSGSRYLQAHLVGNDL